VTTTTSLGHHDIVELLCKKGADVNAKNANSIFPLHAGRDSFDW
jgi:ankyrin repeat protein